MKRDFYRATQNSMQFTTELFISGIFHWILSEDCGWPQMTETVESETRLRGKGAATAIYKCSVWQRSCPSHSAPREGKKAFLHCACLLKKTQLSEHLKMEAQLLKFSDGACMESPSVCRALLSVVHLISISQKNSSILQRISRRHICSASCRRSQERAGLVEPVVQLDNRRQ